MLKSKDYKMKVKNLKLVAKTEDDIRVLSAHLQDSIVNTSDIANLKKNKILSLPHSLIEKIIRQNKIKVNKKKTKSSYRLQLGDLIEIYDISKLKPTDNEKKSNTFQKEMKLVSMMIIS